MSELVGILAAVLSSALGGTAIGATRYLATALDPLATGAFRFGIGFFVLLFITLLMRQQWPQRREWPAIAGLGLLFFFVFPILFNASLAYTTAARGALSLSTLPLLTMIVGAALYGEPMTLRTVAGVLIAMLGVAIALVSGLRSAPAEAWRGDLLMVAAALCMAFYSVWSRRLMSRVRAISFTTMAMGIGTAGLVAVSLLRESFAPVSHLSMSMWLALVYLGAIGGALTFYLWSFALERTTPTRVAISVTVNPISATTVGAMMLGEPTNWALCVGIVTVFIGIWLAAAAARPDPTSA